MSRIPTPATIEAAPAGSRSMLEAVKKQLGSVPNIFRIVSASPAALEGYLALNGALSKGAIDGKTRERIALAVAELNGCSYCLSAHTYLARNVAGLDDAEISANRRGASDDTFGAAAVKLALSVARQRGRLSDTDIEAARSGGLSDAMIVEVVSHVALNTFTNFVNKALQTEIDFPVVGGVGSA